MLFTRSHGLVVLRNMSANQAEKFITRLDEHGPEVDQPTYQQKKIAVNSLINLCCFLFQKLLLVTLL